MRCSFSIYTCMLHAWNKIRDVREFVKSNNVFEVRAEKFVANLGLFMYILVRYLS